MMTLNVDPRSWLIPTMLVVSASCAACSVEFRNFSASTVVTIARSSEPCTARFSRQRNNEW